MFENRKCPLLQDSEGLHIYMYNEALNWWLYKLHASESLICLVKGTISDDVLRYCISMVCS